MNRKAMKLYKLTGGFLTLHLVALVAADTPEQAKSLLVTARPGEHWERCTEVEEVSIPEEPTILLEASWEQWS